ncbi:MAG: DUF5329 family protein [Planctomycetota bacterium]
MHTRLSTVLAVAALAAPGLHAQVERDHGRQHDGAGELRLVAVGETDWPLTSRRDNWLHPEGLRGIEVVGDAALEVTVGARLGDHGLKLRRDEEHGRQVLDVDDALRKAWTEHGRLSLSVQGREDRPRRYELRAIPSGLPPAADCGRVTLVQRHEAALPGSNGWLLLSIDDITRRQTLTGLRTAEGEVIVDTVSLGAGDEVAFRFAGKRYVLRLAKLVNLLIGDDWAEFELREHGVSERWKIDRLLAWLEHEEGVRFVREGKEYDGRRAAQHLRTKYEAAKDRVTTLEAFLTDIAAKSSTTGNAYRVRVSDDETVGAEAWFRDHLGEALAPPKEAAGTPGTGVQRGFREGR